MIYAAHRTPKFSWQSLGKRPWAFLGMPSKRLILLKNGKQAVEELGNACFVIHDGKQTPSSAFGSSSNTGLERKGDWIGLVKSM